MQRGEQGRKKTRSGGLVRQLLAAGRMLSAGLADVRAVQLIGLLRLANKRVGASPDCRTERLRAEGGAQRQRP